MIKHIELAFEKLSKAGLKLNPEKCTFGVTKLDYLGHVISPEGTTVCQKKVDAVRTFEIPKTVTQVKSFLGLTSYYRRYIRDYAKIARPLHDLTRKDKPFEWNSEADNAFKELKRKLMTAPLLSHPIRGQEFRVLVDTSKTSVGFILEQTQNGENKVICYGGKSLSPTQSKYGSSQLEGLGVITALKDLDTYLRGNHFKIITDHQPLKYLFDKPPSAQWSRWAAILWEYDAEIIYKPGKMHGAADALSRRKYDDIVTENSRVDQYLCTATVPTDRTRNRLNNIQPLMEVKIASPKSKEVPSARDPQDNSQRNPVILPTLSPNGNSLETFRKAQLTEQVNFTHGAVVKGRYVPYTTDPYYNSQLEPLVASAESAFNRKKINRRKARNYAQNPGLQIEQTHVHINRNDPAQIPSDVIINFVSRDMKPLGVIGKTVQQFGREEYKREVAKSLREDNYLGIGDSRLLKAGDLKCLYVLNVHMPKAHLDKDRTGQMIYDIFYECLGTVAKLGHKSIVFSPIDLSNLGYTIQKASLILSQCLWDYCKEHNHFHHVHIPVQLVSHVTKITSQIKKLNTHPDRKIFSPEFKANSKLQRPDKYVTDPQQLIQDIASQGIDQNFDPQNLILLNSKKKTQIWHQ